MNHPDMYRCWDKANRQWIDEFYINQRGEVHIQTYCDIEYEVILLDVSDRVVLERYTGFNDEKGIPVYTGDIVNFDARELGSTYNKFVVSFNDKDGEFCFGNGSMQDDMQWRTVIGNIHENPDIKTYN